MGENIVLNGVVVKGLGEGAFFLSIEHYKNEIKKKLGFDAYLGTLNLMIDIKQLEQLKKINPIKINGFKKNNEVFFGARCYRGKIRNINGAIIKPDMNKHKEDVIEFIAPVHLKTELKIKDGDKIKIELEP